MTSTPMPMPMPLGAAPPRCAYQAPDAALTLREGLAEYKRAHPELVDADDATEDGGRFFRAHDACHVVFGTNTSLFDEALTDFWTIFGVDITLREYGAFLSTEEGKEVTKQIGAGNILKALFLVLPRIPQVWWRTRRMTKKWPWLGYTEHLDRPLAEIRQDFGIELIER